MLGFKDLRLKLLLLLLLLLLLYYYYYYYYQLLLCYFFHWFTVELHDVSKAGVLMESCPQAKRPDLI